ncbi:MAG: hypothetical protein QOH39_2579 [Verrucomicrobiota bacterium]|jgi:hypothetical protein
MRAFRTVAIFRRFLGATSCALALSLFLASPAHAAASDELSRAVTKGGSPSIKEASVAQFLNALNSILVRKKISDFPAYVAAAVKVRPDLADKIVVSALAACHLKKHGEDKRLSFETIDLIIRAAVSADPEAVDAIVKAAIMSEPYAQDCIVAAAIAAAPDQELAILRAAGEIQTMAFLQRREPDSINPVNFSGEIVNSPEQPPSGP